MKLTYTPVADSSFEYQGYKIQIINGSENIKTTINSIGQITQVKSMDKTKSEPLVSCQSCLDFDLTICQIQYDIENDQVRVSPKFIKSFEKKNFSLTKEALEDLNFQRSFNQFYRITKYIKKGFDFDPISMFKLSCKLFNQPANLINFDSMVAFCFSDEDPLNYREALKINIDVERNKMKLLDKIEDLKKINSEEANKGYIS